MPLIGAVADDLTHDDRRFTCKVKGKDGSVF